LRVLSFFPDILTTANLLDVSSNQRTVRIGAVKKVRLSKVYKNVAGLMARCSLAVANQALTAHTVFRLEQSDGSIGIQFTGIFEKSREYISWTSSTLVQVNQIIIETSQNDITCTSLQLQYINCK
jgi:hypothetical protein